MRSMLRVGLAVPVLLAMAGCPPDVIDVSNDRCDLFVEAPIITLVPSPVGVEVPVTVRVVATDADCEVATVHVENLDGAWFSERASAAGAIHVARGESAEIPLTYFPHVDGYHRARITLGVIGGREPNVSFELRGHAASPAYTLYPYVVDFGPVAVGEVGTGAITIDNRSDLDLVIDDFVFSATDGVATTAELSVAGEIPLVVPARYGPMQISVQYAPTRVRKMAAKLSLSIGGAQTYLVQLVANDCSRGTPGAFDEDRDGFSACGGDCDDEEASVHPGGLEFFDGKDNDCNRVVDDMTARYDDDGDGYCEWTSCVVAGVLPGDCVDGDASVNPGVAEVCPSADPVCSDGIDNNCDQIIDNGSEDQDGDGYTALGGDCEVVDAHVHPGAREVPNGRDDDCDHQIDEGTVNYDDDGDGFAEVQGDCDDSVDPLSAFQGTAVHPGHAELADHRDNDCDGMVDEGTYFADDDADGYIEGDPLDASFDDRFRDCDDGSAARSPSNAEIPGDRLRLDEDCDPATGP